MNQKEKVIAGLKCCIDGIKCTECPYSSLSECDKQLCTDAIDLINANDTLNQIKANDEPKYSQAIIYTKRTSLLSYARAKYPAMPEEQLGRLYSAPREVELILLVRWEGNRIFCQVKCPINPLPIQGEFEAPSLGVIGRFLVEHGWEFKHKMPIALLK